MWQQNHNNNITEHKNEELTSKSSHQLAAATCSTFHRQNLLKLNIKIKKSQENNCEIKKDKKNPGERKREAQNGAENKLQKQMCIEKGHTHFVYANQRDNLIL